MAQDSKIEWTNHTLNLWHGCTNVGPGCDHCYAEVISHRWKRDLWGNDKPRMQIKSAFHDVFKYQKLAMTAGEMHRVFIGSMMDIFEKPMPLIDSKGNNIAGVDTRHLRNQLFDEITRGYFSNLILLLLTKRETNINKMIPSLWRKIPPRNVMYGVSVVNQKEFDRVVNNLQKVNGKKFLSIEPQLEFIDLNRKGIIGIDWIIQGGESGHYKRPFDLQWARSMRDQCAEYGIPYFFKQIDKVQAIPEDLQIRQFP